MRIYRIGPPGPEGAAGRPVGLWKARALVLRRPGRWPGCARGHGGSKVPVTVRGTASAGAPAGTGVDMVKRSPKGDILRSHSSVLPARWPRPPAHPRAGRRVLPRPASGGRVSVHHLGPHGRVGKSRLGPHGIVSTPDDRRRDIRLARHDPRARGGACEVPPWPPSACRSFTARPKAGRSHGFEGYRCAGGPNKAREDAPGDRPLGAVAGASSFPRGSSGVEHDLAVVPAGGHPLAVGR
jgi:hypothetical protein